MPQFGRRKSNVVRGRFGERRGRTWLSADDYSQLSPTEKKRLWREREHDRQMARHDRRFRRRPARTPQWKQKLAFVGVLAVIGSVTWLTDKFDAFTTGGGPSALLSASGPVEAVGERSFGPCVWGGGENCVVDGDTFYLDGTKIRIAGIDAPETHDFKCPSEKSLGDRATARLQELLNSGPLELSSIDRDEDVFGRKLRNVVVGGAEVGETLISEGLAREYRGYKRPWC